MRGLRQLPAPHVLLVAGLLLVGACASPGGAESSGPDPTTGFDRVTTTAGGFEPIATTTSSPTDHPGTTARTTTGAPSGPSTTAPVPPPIEALLAQLVIAPEGSVAPYERDRFEHWIDADDDGCHTRCEVLAAERRTDVPGIPTGGWVSIYDSYVTDDPSELEVDHVVALAEAWRSGASTWDDARRRDFANDLDEPGALVAVTSATNRAKSDRDPARWQPSNRDAWCEWGLGWLRTKVKWGLTADEAEARALTNILRGC